jgi:hypothetical protein
VRGRRVAVAAVVVVTLFALVYLLPETGGRGYEMDEGALVSYPSRVLDGAVPHRDFLTFYGPGNLWLVAGAFATVGESVETERAVGMLYRLVVVGALFLVGLRLAGVAGATLAGLVAAVRMGEELVWAYATYGALAFGLLGIALTAWAATAARGRLVAVGLVAGGVAGGMAVLVRFDFALAVLLGALPLLTLVRARARWWWVGGFLGAMTLYVVHAALVGPERIARVVSDLIASGPGRELPIPRPWVYPGTLLTLSGLILLLFLGVGAALWRRQQYEPVPQVLVAVALFDLGIVPYALSRADAFHIRPVALIPLGLLPAFALFVVRAAVTKPALRRTVAVGVIVASSLAIVDYGDFTLDRARETRHVRDAYRGFYDDDSGPAASAVVARTRALARPGDSLFVGPQDLRRTNYGPTYVYFLLSELRPASYYMEMNPGTANREGSGLADELRRADWLILTSEWDNWNEPNESMDYGPSEPNDVVRDDFCLRLERGQYRLYERCDRAA